jgi:exoribonuclease-2
VLPDDELDLEARRRSTSLYLPTGIVPMFPLELAAGSDEFGTG